MARVILSREDGEGSRAPRSNMAQEFSFDVVSKTDMQEVANAIQQAQKELAQRFDFKGSKSSIELNPEEIVLISDDEGKLRSVKEIEIGRASCRERVEMSGGGG